MPTSAHFRNSPWSILADYLGDSLKIALLAAGLLVSRSLEASSLSSILSLVGAVYLGVLVAEPPLRFIGQRYALTPQALVHRTGILRTSERSFP